MSVLSIDLAYKRHSDIGVAVLQRTECSINVELVRVPLPGTPAPDMLAEYFAALAHSVNARLMLIDGPQGWKDPNNGLLHSRICERVLNTPAKTGLPGSVKPGAYLPFVSFSIAVYDALNRLGWPRITAAVQPSAAAVVESFPLSAWRSLGLPFLPAKAKTSAAGIHTQLGLLQKKFPIRLSEPPNHDELQALVSGLAGIALESGDPSQVSFSGTPPSLLEGQYREGYIVNPMGSCHQADCGASSGFV